MNFKIKSLFALLIISVFLLSSCEVYNTLYGSAPKEPVMAGPDEVLRIDGAQAEDPAVLAKTVYSSSEPTQHDPFKTGENPLGPFPKGKSLGFTLQQWLSAGGIGIYSVDGDKADLDLSFKNLVPKGTYTVWCSRLTFPPEPKMENMPCGAEDGSENSFISDEKGMGTFSLKIKPLEPSSKETASAVVLAYHSDGKTYGASPGDFGLNSHVQLFFILPEPTGNATKFEVPIKFTNHIDAGLPEQDVFIEAPEKAAAPAATGESVAEEEVADKEETPQETDNVEVIQSEETSSEKPKEKPIVVIVQETDRVSLAPKAEDPDKNTNLAFTFTSPLDENGEWQTNYGDAGQYTITITASDGELTATRDVLIIVNKKEEAPTIDSAKPIESGLSIDETQSVDFNLVASDLNKDPLMYSWKLDGVEAGTDSKYSYQTDYDSAGTHTIKADVSDGISTASKIWSVDVKNVNRKPVLEKISDIKVKETDKVIITALATDEDNDPITYSISDKRFAQDSNVFTWQTDYDSAGTYEIKVSAGDGKDTVEQTFTLAVENMNRPPVIVGISQK